MTAALLPDGLTVRPIGPDDAELVTAQLGAYTNALIGYAKYSLEDVANYQRDPQLDLANDSWLVFDGEKLVGTGTTLAHLGTGRVSHDAFAADPRIAGWLLDRGAERAVEVASGGDQVTLSVSLLGEDRQLQSLLGERGYAFETSIQRMRIDHDGSVPTPEVPAGVVIRRGAYDEAARRAGHAVITAAFADQPSAVPRPYDEWVASREARSTFHWSDVTLLELDGRVVGYRDCSDHFVESDGCGYISRLAVLDEARGRGLAKYLLRDQFALDAAAGRSGTILHVDSSNPTPAVGLYLGVGMAPTLVSEVWTRTVAPR
ncbi:acetyltransferase (GNAT) family protein [Kribbella amoyensis]|uniref:Acetyltransferase (GNAT) family protein n=1 Tax=Kribbella amoyensis TaxID=996641 RepID=A0A561BXR7_9ACTN|nr:GNAT family N-acetyltransferase [Kribbella amoyensis]TWD83657.1 acetyltransferase (GNAT) family protein [Kribbella amoyensis]